MNQSACKVSKIDSTSTQGNSPRSTPRLLKLVGNLKALPKPKGSGWKLVTRNLKALRQSFESLTKPSEASEEIDALLDSFEAMTLLLAEEKKKR